MSGYAVTVVRLYSISTPTSGSLETRATVVHDMSTSACGAMIHGYNKGSFSGVILTHSA